MRPLALLSRVLCVGMLLAVTASTAQDDRPADESPAISESLSFFADLVKETEYAGASTFSTPTRNPFLTVSRWDMWVSATAI